MLKRLKQLQISLAAKCQILFGAAVVLIIGAALYVPWQRMEQLTQQLNEKSAAEIARTTVGLHVARETARLAMLEQNSPVAPTFWKLLEGWAAPTTVPAKSDDAPLDPVFMDGQLIIPPRLLWVDPKDHSDPPSPFESAALARFISDPNRPFYARAYITAGGLERYRYAQPLLARAPCMSCHVDSPDAPVQPTARKIGAPILSGPTTRPALLGIVSVDIPSQIATRQLLLNRVFLITAGLLAGSVAIVVFYLITTRLILQPVRVLQETAEKVSQGDLNIRSDINTGDEFQQLSETFNTMLVNLKKSADQLRAVNKSLDLKLGQLAESNLALYEANRLKSEFLANVSHELRTPLNSILGFAELLKDQLGSNADPKLLRFAQNIHNSGSSLLDLINDLLDLAKIEAGKMDVRSEPLSLSDVFEGLISLLKPLSEPKKLRVVSDVAEDVPIIRTDPAKLQQVLYNFLSNAIKFSPVGGRVDVVARREDGQIRISVTDQGPGIDPANHTVIFEKFRQLDASVTRQHGGTGLGLAISKELARLMGGSVGVISTPGQGATFWLVIPLSIEPSQQDVRTTG